MICDYCGAELERLVIYTEIGLMVVWTCNCVPTGEEEDEAILDAEWERS